MSDTPTNRFKADMPAIPGLGERPAATPAAAPAAPASNTRASNTGRSAALSIALGVTVVVVGGLVWWVIHFAGRSGQPVRQVAIETPAPVDPPPAPVPEASGPVTAASLKDLASPWAAKEFTFVDPFTRDAVPAIVVHLAGEPVNSSSSYWAFSLEAPYQTCKLEYITDLSQLAARFDFHATHPMVASPCDGTIYDPLKMGTIASGAWVRGDIVQGAGIRPPISIEVKIEGGNLVADRIE